jgi:hypothetical protein
MTINKKYTLVLLCVVLLNYVAQIPYYLHQYYFPHHLAPNWSGVALLVLTLIWFLFGYFRFVNGNRFGRSLLLSFLLAQVIFYGHSLVFSFFGGGMIAQLRTHSPFLLVVFLIGDLNFLVALYYFLWLLFKRQKR